MTQAVVFKPFMAVHRAHRHTQRGITTVQIAIGILVSIIALVGSFGGFQYVAQAKVNTDMNMMADLKTATVRYGSTLGAAGFTFANVNTDVLKRLGFFDSAGYGVYGGVLASTATHQSGGTVQASLPLDEGVMTPVSEGITFTWKGLPSTACRELALRVGTLAWSVEAANKGDGALQTIKSKGINANNFASAAAENCNSTASVNKLVVTFSRN